MHANDRKDIDKVYAGDIAAAVGLKNVVTGDTLCVSSSPVVLESMNFPEPVIKVSVEPKTKSDQEKMSIALGRLAQEDPTFRVETNEESGQTEISGMGELHLEVLVDRMKREFKVEANVGRPQVSYRETVKGTAQKVEGRFVRQTVVRASSASCTSTSSRTRARASGSSTPRRVARSRPSTSRP